MSWHSQTTLHDPDYLSSPDCGDIQPLFDESADTGIRIVTSEGDSSAHYDCDETANSDNDESDGDMPSCLGSGINPEDW